MIWLCACLVDGALYRERRAQLTDDDGDHWTEAAGDCNDADNDVHPEAADVCNQTDDDCDGSVDEDMPTWFLDDDEDGFGDAMTAVATCDTPGGFVANDDDCDDENPTIHPGAPETCNGLDDDCDERVDSEDDDLEGGISLYTDDDQDGYGDDATERVGCAGDKDAVEVAGDCDDTTQSVHPGAEPEICEDGIDTNCDGTGLGCTGSAATADALFYGEASGDDAGLETAGGVDINGDGYDDLLIGARFNDDAAPDSGAAYVILGPVATGEQSLNTSWAKLTGASGDSAGRGIAFPGDIDSDGVQDIAVSAPLSDSTAIDAGTVYIVSASDLRAGISNLADLAWHQIHGKQNSEYCGVSIIAGGDENGDGVDDFWIGAPGRDPDVSDHDPEVGSVFLITGPLEPGTSSTAEHQAELYGTIDTGRDLGLALASEDYDGDGIADLAVGNKYHTHSGYQSGAVFVLAGPITGVLPVTFADAVILADSKEDSLGHSVAANGDLNGDGRAEVVAGAPEADATGKVFVFEGTLPLDAMAGSATATAHEIVQPATADVWRVGSSVAVDGDFTADGAPDVLIGASGAGALGQGAAFLVSRIDGGTVGLESTGGVTAIRLDGVNPNDGIGAEVTFTGHIESSHANGLLVASNVLDASVSDSGGVYLIFDIGI
jgi:hypothetical protein